MECTQRLECTQDLYDTQTEKTCPEQIGFLGICGAKHPVLKGPNKIGRDPQTCNIILNLNSVSRQHAVINVLNSREFMLMDLDSANKTKLLNKTLHPYIPHPIRDGDTVQFGDIFGVFRLLEENDALPMTQAIDVPETPVVSKHVSKLHKAPTTMIPESPDVSDRDDSFITPSHPIGEKSKLSNSSFIKPNNKNISSPPGTRTYGNRKSTIRSTPLSFIEDPNTSLNESLVSLKSDKYASVNIHEMNTQAPYPAPNESTDSIYTADTQIPPGRISSPSIHNADTQIPSTEHLPQVRKIDDQHEMQLDIYAANKENNRDIFNAETQPFGLDNESTEIVNIIKSNSTTKTMSDCSTKAESKEKLNTSEEELLFDDVDESLDEDFNSQNILQEELPFNEDAAKSKTKKCTLTPSKRDMRIASDGLTDCEDIDIVPTQKISELPIIKNNQQAKFQTISVTQGSKRTERLKSNSSTDCEDIEIAPTQIIPELPIKKDTTQIKEKVDTKSNINPIKKLNRIESDSSTDCEDIDTVPTQIIPKLPIKRDTTNKEKVDKKCKVNPSKRLNRIQSDSSTDCEDNDMVPTQIIPKLPIKKDTTDKEQVDKKCKVNPSKRLNRIQSDSSTDCEDIEMAPTQIIPKLPIKKDTTDKEKVDKKCKVNPSKRLNRVQSDSSTDCEDNEMAPTQIIPKLPIKKDTTDKEQVDKKCKVNPSKRLNRIQSDSSTDCEEINLTQKIPEKKFDAGNIIDCDDNIIEVKTIHAPAGELIQDDIATQIIDLDVYVKDKLPFEDKPTQIIDVIEVANNSKNVSFEDQPTQIIDQVANNTEHIKTSFDELVSPFKIPLQSSIKVKTKEIVKLTPKDITDKNKPINVDDCYYNATQDIYDDLCSQREKSNNSLVVALNADVAVVPCSVENNKDREVNPGIGRELSPIAKLKRVPSDSSDIECTPKKVKQFIFTDSDLPDSQEIKTSMISRTRSTVTESSSESETENCSEDQTPFLHRKKKPKPIVKLDLTKMFGVEKLPERVLTRQRKPTAKLQNCTEVNKTLSTSILKPTYLTEQEDQIDGEIITENIQRLKTFEKAKTNKDTKNDESVKEVKKESTTRKKTDSKSNEHKEKIKVKIERPKRKDTKSKTESSAGKSDVSVENKTKEGSPDSTSAVKTTARKTRSKKNETGNINTDRKSVSPENNKKETDNKRKRTTKKQEKERSPSPGIRRSKRQQKAKEKNDDEKVPKSILKKSVHEQSTVYNISSSSSESSRSLKRSLVDDDDGEPTPKRTRPLNPNNSSSINNASLRATPARVMKTQHVLFTAFPSPEVKQKLEKLGAVIVTDVLECSVVLTVQVKRTFKLLCAVGLGRPIVGPGWVQACADTHIIVDPWLYLVKDESAEKRFGFNLQRTLNSKRNFLKGYNVSSTPSVQPNASEMKLIVECSGGTWKEAGPNWVCVSCTKDKGLWPALRKRGATVVSTEFILGGVLRQKLEIDANTFR